MTIIEALKSGKAFRRQSWGKNGWLMVNARGEAVTNYGTEYCFQVETLLADDWETVEDQKIEVKLTHSELVSALERATALAPVPPETLQAIAKELGF